MANHELTEEQLKEQNNLVNELNRQMMNLNSGSNQYSKSLVKQNQLLSDGLKELAKHYDKSQQTRDAYNEMKDVIDEIKDGEKSINDLIDLQNKALQQGKLTAARIYGIELKRLRVEKARNQVLNAADDLTGGMASKAQEMLGTFEELGGAVGLMTVGLLAAIALLVTFNKQQQSIADQFGAIGVTRLRDDLGDVNAEFLALGIEASEAQKTVSELSNEFGVGLSEASELAKVVGETQVATGATLDNATKLIGVLTQTQGLTAEQASDLIKSTQSLAFANDVAPDKVLEDVASNTDQFAKFAKDGGKNVLEAAIQARKLGLSLDKVAGISENLLNFNDSLTKEIEASVIIGRQINLQKARELALANDIKGATAEVVKQMGSEAEFNKLNAIQRQALADAIGVQVGDLQKMVSAEKEATTLQGELSKQKITDIVSEEALTSTAQLINNLKALGVTIAESVGPTLNILISVFSGLLKTLKETGLIFPVLIGGLGLYIYKSGLAFMASIANSKAILAETAARKKKAAAEAAETAVTNVNTTAKGINTFAIGASTTATTANTTAKLGNNTMTTASATVNGVETTATIGNTASKAANTLATNVNTGAKRAGIGTTLMAAGAAAVNSAANFFAGAAKGSAKTAGIGALLLVPIAIASVLAMIGMIALAGRAIGSVMAGDTRAEAGKKPVLSLPSQPNKLIVGRSDDDVLMAPGIAGAANGGGGATVVNATNTSAMESKQEASNQKLDKIANILDSAFGGPRPALARAMASGVSSELNGMA